MTCEGQPQLLHLPWIWPVESVALPLSSGRHTPATSPAHPDVRAQPCVDCAVPLGEPSALFPSHLRQEPRCFSFEGTSPYFLTPFCSRNAASSAPSREQVIGSRQNTMRVHPSLPSTFLHGFALQYRTCDTNCTGALFNTLFSQYCLRTATCSAPNSFVEAKLRRNATHTYTKGDRVALERLRALLLACS